MVSCHTLLGISFESCVPRERNGAVHDSRYGRESHGLAAERVDVRDLQCAPPIAPDATHHHTSQSIVSQCRIATARLHDHVMALNMSIEQCASRCLRLCERLYLV